MKHELPHLRVWKDGTTHLLLFPDDSSPSPEARALTQAPPTSENFAPGNFPPSLAEITSEWQMLLKRLGHRHRVLETVLAAGRPIRLTDDTLIIGFSPQRRFHQELLDMPEYRRCVEEELARRFQVRLWVATALSPENRHLQHQRTFGKTPA